MIRSAALAVALCGAATAAVAQSVDPPRLEASVEVERLRRLYHFSNPSAFDTPQLVPHFFEQRYEVEDVWASLGATYTAAIVWRTAGGATVPRDGRADDFDTFFNPDASVIVSGTTGGARMQSLRFSQEAQIARGGGARVWTGYRIRIDRADFGIGHKTVTRNGVLAEAEDVTSREITRSQIHEFFAAVSAARRVGRGWRVTIDGEASPVTVARLVVELPGKYPGQDLAFVAKAFAAQAQVRFVRAPFDVMVGGGHIWSYGEDEAIAQGRLTVGVGFTLR